MKTFRSALVLVPLMITGFAHATTYSVAATDVIYCPGNSSCAASAGGTAPVGVSVSGLSSLSFSVSGMVTLNNSTLNDADGVGAATASSSNFGISPYAGISAPGAGYLVGLFTSPTDNTPGVATAYTTASESAASFSPTLNQAFFIGDGLTGDGVGATQVFYVPTGATELYLGISDAPGYNGTTGSYGDNNFDFTVGVSGVSSTTTPPAGTTPEPSSLMLLGTGLLSACGVVRRRVTK